MIRRWTAPSAGSIRVTGRAYDLNPDCGDGVLVSIRTGGATRWERVIANGDATGASYDVTAAVAAQQAVDFVINKRAEYGCDSTFFSATIVFTPAGSSPAPTPTPPANQAPVARAGSDQALTLPAAATLEGTVSDDGLPTGQSLTVAWSQVSGPGTAALEDPAAPATTATFSVEGSYVLRLTAHDGALSASDDLTVTVQPATPPHRILYVALDGTGDGRGSTPFGTIQKAVDAAAPGDTVLVRGGVYRQCAVIPRGKKGISIVGEPGAHLRETACSGKGALVVQSEDVTIEGLECSGISSGSGNGACVRNEAASLTIRNVYFHDNQTAYLGGEEGAPTGTILIENSRFERNGQDGTSHNVYIAKRTPHAIFRNNVVYHVTGGHGVKCGAKKCEILNNVIAHLGGSASKVINVQLGGEATIQGNVLEQGPGALNRWMITVADEPFNGIYGTSHPDAIPGNHQIVIKDNIMVFDRPGSVLLYTKSPQVDIPITVQGNTLVNMTTFLDADAVGAQVSGEVDNTYFSNRAAAGLAAYPLLPSPTPGPAGSPRVSAEPHIMAFAVSPAVTDGPATATFHATTAAGATLSAAKVYRSVYHPFGCREDGSTFNCEWQLIETVAAPSGTTDWPDGQAALAVPPGVSLFRLDVTNSQGDSKPSDLVKVVNPNLPPLACNPLTATVEVDAEAVFTSTGGATYHAWKAVGPSGGVVSSGIGHAFSFQASAPGTFPILVADGHSTARCHLVVAPGAGDPVPPTVALTAPAPDATVSGSAVTLAADASDNIGVIGVRFQLDGTALGAEDPGAPYALAWDTTGAANGSHVLTAIARDAAGNRATSSPITVMVDNGAPPPCTPSWSCTAWGACVDGIQTRTCTDANSCGDPTGKPAESQGCTVNRPPVADAGPDRVTSGGTVSLDGRGSTDPDGDPLTYQWQQTAGPAVTLLGATSATASFTPPVVQATTDFRFTLTVHDGSLSGTDAVTVTVLPDDPTPPTEPGLELTAVTEASATLRVTTEQPTRVRVAYGYTTAYGQLVEDTTLARTHTLAMAPLTAGSLYTFQVTTQEATGTERRFPDLTVVTLGVQDVEPPGAVGDLGASDVSDLTAALAWTAPGDDGVSGTVVAYEVQLSQQRLEGAAAPFVRLVERLTGLKASGQPETLPLSDLSPQTAYFAQVRARDDRGLWGAWSNEVTFTTQAPIDRQPPRLFDAAITAVTTEAATLTWRTDEPADSRADYSLEPGTFTHQAQDGTRVIEHHLQLTGLTPATRYYVRLSSADTAGNRATQEGLTFVTGTPDTTPPTPPGALRGTAALTAVELVWAAASDDTGVVGYTVLRNGDSLATVSGLTYHDTGLAPDTAYTYLVRAQDAAGNVSALSSAVTVTTLAPPPPAPVAPPLPAPPVLPIPAGPPQVHNLRTDLIRLDGWPELQVRWTTSTPAIGWVEHAVIGEIRQSPKTPLGTTHQVAFRVDTRYHSYTLTLVVEDPAGRKVRQPLPELW
ncbi:MAG: fibronectin type III domain-containing protein [Candidatus Omnitrophica bacterium]|nr:fibronectin type III domain-containing protein [Candidatus Omnitrophota bacterium]